MTSDLEGTVCRCPYGTALTAYCSKESKAMLVETFGEDFMVPKSQCDHYRGRWMRDGKLVKFEAVSADDCNWAEKAVRAKEKENQAQKKQTSPPATATSVAGVITKGAAAVSAGGITGTPSSSTTSLPLSSISPSSPQSATPKEGSSTASVNRNH